MNITDFSTLISVKLSYWLETIIKLLPNIALAAVILVLGIYIAGFVRKIGKKIIGKISHNITLNNLFASILYMIFLGIVIFTVLTILNLDKAVTSILAGAGILGLALAFAFQDIATNFMSGIFISFRKPLKVGDTVKIKDFMGVVKEINLRDTIVETFQGQEIIIPNKEVFQNPITNYSSLNKRRFDLNIRISHGDDLEKVKQVAFDAVKDIEELSKNDTPSLFFTEFGDSYVNLCIRMWINTEAQGAYLKVGSESIVNIKAAFKRNEIIIPFPIRTLDFDIKGGKTLAEMPVSISEKSE